MKSILSVVLAGVLMLTGPPWARAQTPSPDPQASAAGAQGAPPRSPIPDTFTNLQVLPKNIRKPELVRIMKSFALTFEKRCSFCHVATDDLSQADFASDEKETKRKARELLQFIGEAQGKPTTTP